MDVGRGNSIPEEEKDYQNQSPWIPVTPVRPILPRPQPIYAERQNNQLGNGNWAESVGFPTGFSRENEAQRNVASLDTRNSVEPNRGVDCWEAAAKSNNGGMYGKGYIDPMAGWNNIRFVDLLTQAALGSTRTKSDAIPTKIPIVSGFSFHVGGGQPDFISGNPSPAHQNEAEQGSQNTCSPQVTHCELSISGEHTYDLNALPETMVDELPLGTNSQFAPITPDNARRLGSESLLEIPNLCLDERKDQEKAGVEVDGPHSEKLPSQADSSFPVVFGPLEENHNPDKGNQAIDLNKTPQQKPRRKKHRPKVVIEGKPKSTRKPATSKPNASKENPTVKRKYVRKKGVNNPSTTPPPQVAAEISDPKPLQPATKSARRALNFDEDGQARNARFSSGSASNLNLESPGEQLCDIKVQSNSTVQINEEVEVMVENTGVGIAYELNHSINQSLKDYISLPTGQAPSTSPPTNTDCPHSQTNTESSDARLKVNAQNEDHMEGIGRMIDDNNQCRSKQILLKSDNLASPRSPNDSNCSTNANLTEEQAKGKKRVSPFVVDKTDLSTMNLNGAHHNSLQTQNKFKVNEFNNTFLKMHFPEIYKKRRTEKGQTSTASSTSSTVTTTAKNIVKATKEHFQNDGATPRGSKANLWISDTQFQRSRSPTTQGEEFQATQDELQAFECMLALRHTERLTKKRSKGPTRVRDLASLIGIAGSTLLLNFPEKQTRIHEDQGAEISQRPPNCIEALVAETRATLARRKRSKKRNPLINSVSSSTYVMQENQRNILSARHEFISKKIDTRPELILENSVDAITEGLKHLDINKESETFPHQEYNALVPYNTGRPGPNLLVPCNMGNQEQNALVLYRRDGTLIPFDGSFNIIKRRRPRPKVDLDEETTRVWKLLLENINNEGIDGTDEEKARWWEEERRVFRGRADSFIARMHLVQGDRRFSPWKGSVVDSVVGVFLTQNVSDHLSSSAYMSLAARFPLKQKSDQQSCYEEGTKIIVEEPEVCILDSEENLIWKEKMPDNLVCDQSSMTLYDSEHNEEKEVVNSNESSGSNTSGLSSSDDFKSKLVSSGIDLTNFHVPTSQTLETETACMVGDRRSIEDVISSQSSVDSSITQSAERIGPCPESNSRTKDPAREPNSNNIDGSTSFLKLLQMAGDPSFCEGHNQGSHLIPSDKNLKEHDQPAGMGYDEQRQSLVRLDSPKSSQETSIVPPRDHCSNLTPNSELQEVECINLLEEDSKSCDISDKKDENSLSDKIRSLEETSSKATLQSNLTVSSQESQQFPYVCIQSTNTSQRIEIDLSQSERVGEPTTGESLSQGKNSEAWRNSNLPNLSGEILDVTESTSVFNNQKNTEHKGAESNSKERDQSAIAVTKTSTDLGAKRRRVAKEKNTPFDWDSLRKQAQANGRKRERTANTMDSLDWEAIRCADVSEIAETIKERGMNNMLAERIKDFLNRLVREHGSIDLEWLRDVPPDKAKEYLLSIRGLGLKSVECVRLLTLHHLAFPVDTNVGRIAVRLGWVPLQPLPESLQLHLLELYPVLESIQKYLWPRLCRLDQRTLYELHYQMITFGKVFCTKSKPNCNACPMRGECRHFASAFASARLALPGPEEKSIVSATENRAADHNPDVITTPLPLPLPPANQQSGENSLLEAKSGISNIEPIIEEPATPEPERIQVPESDIEDTCYEDPDEIPTIKLNIEEFTQNLQNYMQENMELQDGDVSKALVALTPEAASIPMQKLKNVSRLRTEHQVYELPDSHPLLKGLDNREPDDPCSYLLAIWTPGETANSIQPPEQKCNSQEEGYLCSEMTCFSCNSIREANSQIVRGTLLIPCRTAMRGSFPLNGTYFQVNEVFADHDSSLNPIDVPRAWLWNLPRRTVYFGTSIPTIFKGLTTEGIQYCFWRGFVCVRGFDQKTRAPRPLMARLHFPASKLAKTKAKTNDN